MLASVYFMIFMVLSANENLPPNKAIPKPKSSSLLQSGKTWARILRGTVKTSSTASSSTIALTNVDRNADINTSPASHLSHFASYSERPFLKGTVPDSVLIDITHVSNRISFLEELASACDNPTDIWHVVKVIRRDSSKLFAELVVSSSFEEKLCTIGVKLPSFEKPFVAYPSLALDADILRISFENLPSHYGRGDKGLQDLHNDMRSNLSSFGTIIDCGKVCGLAGLYSGQGYAVLEVHKQGPHRSNLMHVVPWKFTPVSRNSDETRLQPSEVEVFATWNSMAPYCRYCHGNDHAIIDCTKRLANISCYNCHAFGHKAKGCPRRNDPSPQVTANKKARKTPVPSLATAAPSSTANPEIIESTVKSQLVAVNLENIAKHSPETSVSSTTPPSTVLAVNGSNASKYAPKGKIITRSQIASGAAPRIVEQKKPSKPIVCPHCGLEGHVRTTSKACLKYKDKILTTPHTVDYVPNVDGIDTDMEEYDDESNDVQHPPDLMQDDIGAMPTLL